MPHSVIHCYNCHHGILSLPFCLLSSTSFYIYPTMLQLQDFAVFPVSHALSHITFRSISPTLSIRPASSIICSSHTNSQMLWSFVLSSVYKVNFQDTSKSFVFFNSDIFLSNNLLKRHGTLAACPEQGTARIHKGARVNHNNYLYKLVNITVFTYFTYPQSTPSFLRLIATFGLEGSHIAEEISYSFTTSEKLLISGMDLINCWRRLYCQYSGLGLLFRLLCTNWDMVIVTSWSFETQIQQNCKQASVNIQKHYALILQQWKFRPRKCVFYTSGIFQFHLLLH